MGINYKDIRREKSTIGGYVGDGDADRKLVLRRKAQARPKEITRPKAAMPSDPDATMMPKFMEYDLTEDDVLALSSGKRQK